MTKLRVSEGLPLFDVTTLEAVLAASIDRERFRLLLLVMAGWVALVLAGVGIFGVVLCWRVAFRRSAFASR